MKAMKSMKAKGCGKTKTKTNTQATKVNSKCKGNDNVNDKNIVGYVAFTPYDMSGRNSQTDPKQRVQKAWYPDGKFIPLRLTPLAALQAALEKSRNWQVAKDAATKSTEWSILRLSLEPDELAQAFKAGTIRLSSNMQVLEWWTDLDSNCKGRIDWDVTVLQPTSLCSSAVFGLPVPKA
jgi:hypothetical protein